MTKISELAQRPATHLLSTRLDGRYLAALATYWHSRGEPLRSLSELARLSLEAFASLLEANSKVEIPTYEASLEVLSTLGLNRKVNKHNLIVALSKEDLQLDYPTTTTTTTISPPTGWPNSQEGKMVLAELEQRLYAPQRVATPLSEARNLEFKKAFSVPPTTSTQEGD